MRPLSVSSVSRLYGLAIVVACSILIISNSYLKIEVNNSHHQWQLFNNDLKTRWELHDRLTSRLGYGGVIHQFKNYVLRGQDQDYQQALLSLNSSDQVLSRYHQLNPGGEEERAIQQLQHTVDRYRAQLELAHRLILVNTQPQLIDQQVKVDDQPALQALRNIRRILSNQRSRVLEDMDQMMMAVQRSASHNIWFALGIVFLMLLIPYWLINRCVLLPLDLIGQYLNKITHGDNSAILPPINQSKEVANIGLAIGKLQATQAELHLAQEKLNQKYIHRYVDIFENTHDGIIIVDTESLAIKEANPSFCHMFNMSLSHVLESTFFELFELSGSKHKKELNNWLHSDKIFSRELKLCQHEGRTVFFQVTPFRLAGALALVLQDITGRKKASEYLGRLLNENRALIRNNINMLENERSELSRELHDEMGQLITAIKLDAGYIQDHVSHVDTQHAAQDIVDLCKQLLSSVQSITNRLRPSILDQLGLCESVDELINTWRQRNKQCQYQLDMAKEIQGLSEDINIAVYRLLQEALNNVAKHSNATHCQVRLYKRTGQEKIKLIVWDNGDGFDREHNTAGMGLPGMRERSQSLGGEFHLSSNKNGTTIEVTLPMIFILEAENANTDS